MNKSKFDLEEQLSKDTLIKISGCHNTCNLVLSSGFGEVNYESIQKFERLSTKQKRESSGRCYEAGDITMCGWIVI